MDRIDDIDIPLEKALLASRLVRGEMLQEIIEICDSANKLGASCGFGTRVSHDQNQEDHPTQRKNSVF